MNSVLVAMLMTCASTTPAGGDYLRVMTPPDNITVEVDHVHVVGRSSADSVLVEVNGRDVDRVAVVDSVFHVHLEFPYGLNEILLTPLSGQPLEVSGEGRLVRVMYGPTVAGKFRKVFSEYRFHDSQAREDCIACHDCACEDLSQVSDESTCLDCHRDFKDRVTKHAAVDDRSCINCHQLDRNLARATAQSDFGNPCYRCHMDKIGEYAQEYIHGPVAGGSCVICHDPHGSKFGKNLVSPERTLCVTCHVEIGEEFSDESVHEPFRNGQCSACHDAHSTANRWVLVKRSEEICLGCHSEQGSLTDHGHPYNVAPRKPLRVDLKLTERGTLECLSCHDPHATESAHLLRIPGQFNCVACHDDKQ